MRWCAEVVKITALNLLLRVQVYLGLLHLKALGCAALRYSSPSYP